LTCVFITTLSVESAQTALWRSGHPAGCLTVKRASCSDTATKSQHGPRAIELSQDYTQQEIEAKSAQTLLWRTSVGVVVTPRQSHNLALSRAIELSRDYTQQEIDYYLDRIRVEFEVHDLYLSDIPTGLDDPHWEGFYEALTGLDNDDWLFLRVLKYQLGNHTLCIVTKPIMICV
jgi:hypothetical protein